MNDPQVNNQGNVERQANVANNTGSIYLSSPNRWERKFRLLYEQIINEQRRNDIIEELKEYKTKLDGTKGLEEKLIDGNVPAPMIEKAARQKESYAKKAEKYSCYAAAQEIDLELFAYIKDRFDVYVYPLICNHREYAEIMKAIDINIVQPLYNILCENGGDDNFLNYNTNNIYGMIYYLTGMCHLNWTDYDNI